MRCVDEKAVLPHNQNSGRLFLCALRCNWLLFSELTFVILWNFPWPLFFAAWPPGPDFRKGTGHGWIGFFSPWLGFHWSDWPTRSSIGSFEASAEIRSSKLALFVRLLCFTCPAVARLDLEKIRASLNTPCPQCGHSITPEERTHVDTEHLECPQCKIYPC